MAQLKPNYLIMMWHQLSKGINHTKSGHAAYAHSFQLLKWQHTCCTSCSCNYLLQIKYWVSATLANIRLLPPRLKLLW